MATRTGRQAERAKDSAGWLRRGLAFQKREARRVVKEYSRRIAITSAQTPSGPRYQVIAGTSPMTKEDLRLSCETGCVLPLGPRGLDPLRLVTILGPYGEFIGSGELTLDELGCIGIRVLSLVSVARPDQVQRPDRGWPPIPASLPER
jgi:hypothetical protein